MIGTKLGSYEITGKLGEGGMGEVYRATDTKLRREVAIKVLPAAFTEDKERLARFEREAQLLAQLQHPNIASIFGLEEGDRTTGSGVRALVMELVEGDDLSVLIGRGPLPLVDAIAIAKQLAEALEAAHEKGIVHRDLKPQNVKVAGDGTVKVLDFGLAKALEAASPVPTADLARSPTLMNSPTLTAAGTQLGVILGTAAYMAPEQARGAAVDKRADIWAFGVVLYEMLTGKRLFSAPTVADTLAQVLTRVLDLDTLPAATPAAIRLLLRRCLERNPKSRLRDIGDARLVLEEPLGGEAETADAHATGVARRARNASVAFAVLAALLAVLLAVSLVRPRGAPAAERGVVRFPLVTDPSLFVYTELTTPFALSPDGATIVFVATKDGAPLHLWTRTLQDPRPRQLDDTEGGEQPAVSPDGEWVAFLVRSNMIRKVRLRGGSATQLATVPSVSASLTWASDDEILFEVLGAGAGIQRISAAGGQPSELIPLDGSVGETEQRRPFVLRRERMVLYASTTADGRTTLAMFSLADGRRARLGIEGVQALGVVDGRLIYSRVDGNLMAVPFDPAVMRVTGAAVELQERVQSTIIGSRAALSEGGTLVSRPGSSALRLVLVDLQGHSTPLGTQVGSFSRPRFSPDPDGRRIVVASGGGPDVTNSATQDLWLLDRDSGESTRLTQRGWASAPAWTPDGRRIVYIQGGPAKPGEIWSLPLDGSAEASRLVDVEGDVIEAVMEPGSRSLVAVRKALSTWGEDLISVRLDTGKASTIFSSASQLAGHRPALPRISPDGRLLAFADHASWEVYVRPLDGAGSLQVTDGGGWSPAWSADSHQLFVGVGNLLSVAELRTVPSLAVASRRILFQLGNSCEDFDVSPDGTSFVVVAPASGDADVLVSAYWTDALRRAWRQNARGGT